MEPFQIGIRLTEELQLHLLKLSGTEGEVTRCNLITERFSNLRNTEREFLSGSSLHIFKVNENTLCCLRTKIHRILCILRYTLEGFKHQVKLANRGKIMLSAARARNLLLYHEFLHLFLGPSIYGALQRNTVFLAEILDNLISTETLLTLLTIHKRVGEACQVTGGNPGLRIHQNGTVDTDIILGLLYEFLPPGLFNVVFQLYTQVSVIPCIGKTAINLRTRIHKSSGFCQGNNRVHRIILCHKFYPLPFLPK